MHIKSPLINVTSPAAEKRRARVRWGEQRGVARRGDIRVRETEGERCGEQMTRCTFGRASRTPRGSPGDL